VKGFSEHVALLRGRNVGGSKPIKMEVLRGAFRLGVVSIASAGVAYLA